MNFPFDLSKFGQYFQAVPFIDKGIARLLAIIGSEEVIVKHNLEEPFRALCETIVFDEAFKTPFFQILNEWVNDNWRTLVRYVQSMNNDCSPQLSYIASDCLFYSLDYYSINTILDCSHLSSIVYNKLLDANKLNATDGSITVFKSGQMVFTPDICNRIDNKWFHDLWMLRYIRYGVSDDNPQIRSKEKYQNCWLLNLGFGDYFKNYTYEGEQSFVRNTKDWFRGLKPTSKLSLQTNETNKSSCKRRRHRPLKSEDYIVDVNEEAIIESILSGQFCDKRYYDNWSGVIAPNHMDWFTPCVDYASKTGLCMIKVLIEKSQSKSNGDYRLRLVSDYSNTDRKTMRPGLKLGNDIDEMENDHLKDDRYDVEIHRYLESLDNYDPWEIECYEYYVYRTSEIMVKIFNLIKSILDQDTHEVLNYIIDKCIYTAAIKGRLSSTNNSSQPFSGMSKTESFVREFVNTHFTISEDGKEFIAQNISNLCDFLERNKNNLTPRAFVRLFYPYVKDKEKISASAMLKTEKINWKEFPPSFTDAYNVFLQSSSFPDKLKELASGKRSYSDRADCQIRELQKALDVAGENWIQEWISKFWSDEAIKRFNRKQDHSNK